MRIFFKHCKKPHKSPYFKGRLLTLMWALLMCYPKIYKYGTCFIYLAVKRISNLYDCTFFYKPSNKNKNMWNIPSPWWTLDIWYRNSIFILSKTINYRDKIKCKYWKMAWKLYAHMKTQSFGMYVSCSQSYQWSMVTTTR